MITYWQYLLLTINYTLGTTLFVMTTSVIELGRQNSWLIPLWSGLAGIVVLLLLLLLHRYHPGQNFAQILLTLCGSWLGKVFVLLYFLYFSLLSAWVLHNLSDFLKGTYMPNTPKSVFHLMFLVVAAYTAGKGVLTIARFNQFVTPFLFFPFWICVMLGFQDWDLERFLPLFHLDWGKTIFQSHSYIAFPFMEWLVLLMFYPYVGGKAGRALVMGLGMSAISLSMATAFVIGFLGVERASRLNFPFYTFVQEISLGEVVTNIHAVISMVLLILIFIKVVTLFYGVYASLKLLVKLETTWPTLTGLIIFLGALSRVIYINPVQNEEFVGKYVFLYNSIFVILIPLLLLLLTWFKKVGSQRERTVSR